MSKVSTIYDTLLTTLSTLFPSKKRIPNAYVIEDNPTQYLRDSYGVKVMPEAPADSEFCRFSRNRVFGITLSREVLTTEIQTSQFDIAVKALLEDVYTLQKDFLNPDQLGIDSSIEKVDMAGTSSIELFKGDKVNIITIDVLFQIQITDDL